MKELSLAGVEVVLFDKVGANPVKEIVEEGGHFAKKEGCDFIVALGGGSVMDAAKVMAMYAQQPGDLWDYVAGATGKQQPLVNPRYFRSSRSRQRQEPDPRWISGAL